MKIPTHSRPATLRSAEDQAVRNRFQKGRCVSGLDMRVAINPDQFTSVTHAKKLESGSRKLSQERFGSVISAGESESHVGGFICPGKANVSVSESGVPACLPIPFCHAATLGFELGALDESKHIGFGNCVRNRR